MAATLCYQDRSRRDATSILSGYPNGSAVLMATESRRVDEKALLATSHLQDELRHWGVGDPIEGGADAPCLVGVDAPDEIDIEFSPQGSDQVGKRVVGAPQVDWSLQGLR